MVDAARPAKPPRVRRSIRRLSFWVFPVLAVISAWQIWDAIEARRLEAELARVFPDGLETRPRSSSEPPPAEDAAAYYAAANLAAISADRIARLHWQAAQPTPFQLVSRLRTAVAAQKPPAPEDVSLAERLMSIYALPLRLLDHASSLPYVKVSDANVEMALTMTGLISTGAIAGAQTLGWIRRRDAERAVASLVVRVKAQRAYDAEGSWFAAFTKARELSDVVVDVGMLLSQTTPSEASLVRLDEALAAAYGDDDLATLVQSEIRRPVANLEAIGSGRRVTVGVRGVFVRPALRRMSVVGMRTASEVMAAAQLPWPERLHAVDRLQDRRSRVVSGIASAFVWQPIPGGWSIARPARTFAPILGSTLAGISSARVAIAVERYRRTQGSIPEGVDALGLAAADYMDPFTGAPLRYLRSDEGYAIYSIGENLKDDAGDFTGARDVGVRVRGPIP